MGDQEIVSLICGHRYGVPVKRRMLSLAGNWGHGMCAKWLLDIAIVGVRKITRDMVFNYVQSTMGNLISISGVRISCIPIVLISRGIFSNTSRSWRSIDPSLRS